MTVTATSPIVRYAYTGPGDYTFDFRIFKDTDLLVLIIDEEGEQLALNLGVDYNVTTIEGIDGGTINVINPSSAGGTLEIRRILPITQEVDWVNNDPLDAETLEDSFDRLIMILQQLTVTVVEGNPTTNWKGVWLPTTFYQVNDIVTAPETSTKVGNLYACAIEHTSSTDFDTDLSAGFWKLALDVEYIEQLRDECEGFRDECEQYAQQAANSAQQAANSAADAALYRDQTQVSEANAAVSAQNAANCSQAASDSAAAAGASATQAQLYEWEAEAERLTADSYATQDEDVAVDIYTSDGDGTFTATPTSPAEYSAFHWAQKAADVVTGVASITWTAPLENTGDAANHIARIDPAKVTEWDGVKEKADYVIAATGSDDPNAFFESYLVTDHANGPESGTLFHIYQKGVSPVGGAPLEIGDERFQKAVEYQPGPGLPARTFSRSYHSTDGWTAWSAGGGGGGGGGLDWTTAPVTGGITAEDGKGYPMDNRLAEQELTLPLNPSAGAQVGYKDYGNTFNQFKLTVNPNGKRIEGYAVDEKMEVQVRGAGGVFIFIDDDKGWLITDHTPYDIADDGAVLRLPSGALNTGNIYGGEVHYVSFQEVDVTEVSCLADDLKTIINVPAERLTRNLYGVSGPVNVFAVMYDDGTTGFEQDISLDGANLPANVVTKRWVGFFRQNSSNDITEFRFWNDTHWWSAALTISDTTQPDWSTFFPDARASAVLITVYAETSSTTARPENKLYYAGREQVRIRVTNAQAGVSKQHHTSGWCFPGDTDTMQIGSPSANANVIAVRINR